MHWDQEPSPPETYPVACSAQFCPETTRYPRRNGWKRDSEGRWTCACCIRDEKFPNSGGYVPV